MTLGVEWNGAERVGEAGDWRFFGKWEDLSS